MARLSFIKMMSAGLLSLVEHFQLSFQSVVLCLLDGPRICVSNETSLTSVSQLCSLESTPTKPVFCPLPGTFFCAVPPPELSMVHVFLFQEGLWNLGFQTAPFSIIAGPVAPVFLGCAVRHV